MPQPTSDQNSSRREEKWRQNISTMDSNRSVDKGWIRVSKKDGSFQRKERKGQVDSDHYTVQVDSARDRTPLTGRTAQCYMVKQKPSVNTVPINRLEDFHTVKTQGYNHMLSILRGNNTTSLNRNSILSLHMKGLEQLNGLIHRSPTNKPAPREHKQNTASLMGVNCQSSERLDSLWKGHLKTFSDTIPSKSTSNASLGFVQAQKMRTSRHRHPRDRSLQNSEILVEPTKSYQMWLPKVSVESDTSRSQQNILSCSWSSLTGHQRRSKWIGHQREPDRLWQYYASGIPANDDMTNSKFNRNNHMLGALSNAVPEPVSNGLPNVSAKNITTTGAPPPVGFRSLENPPKILTASDQKKFPKSQTVVPSLDSITEDHQLPVNLASPWTNHTVFRSNPELKPTKHPVHEVIHSDKLCETEREHSTPRSRTPTRRTKIPSSNVVTKRATSTTFPNSVFDASMVPSKEQSDNKCHGISPPSQQGHGPISKVTSANLESTPRVDLNGTKKSETKKFDEADSKSKSSWPMNPNCEFHCSFHRSQCWIPSGNTFEMM
ncbi:hypothetical protein FGIG_09180 [Fasciola gigantica]|uniref:Uncharacterized protein n=1 Tax=Fasciola gigantica TaxID=46835 RepID=A0A504YJZ1_FASGI|nr:hypothetical protein FGIG_09180 [Fasciola gigantica]